MFQFCIAAFFALAALTSPVAASDDESMPQVSRVDTLELPDSPPVATFVNGGPSSTRSRRPNNVAPTIPAWPSSLFECGFSQNCQRSCHFLRCGTMN